MLFKTKKKKSRTKPVVEEEDFDRDSVDFIPPSIMVEEKVSDPRAQEIGADSLADNDEEYDRDNVNFLPPIVVEEKVMHTISDPGVKEINPDSLVHKNLDSVLSTRRVSSLGLV